VRAVRLVAEGAQLLDVRSAPEFAAGHVAQAKNIPVDEVASRLGELRRDRPVVVYCKRGLRAARAAEILAGAGFTVFNMGMIDRWPE
jgi:rhodanese-related sulfurtransferase